jgi:hypothetical protein
VILEIRVILEYASRLAHSVTALLLILYGPSRQACCGDCIGSARHDTEREETTPPGHMDYTDVVGALSVDGSDIEEW